MSHDRARVGGKPYPDLTREIIGDMHVIWPGNLLHGYRTYVCRCRVCGEIRIMRAGDLANSRGVSCS
jgi:hypothetical protein